MVHGRCCFARSSELSKAWGVEYVQATITVLYSYLGARLSQRMHEAEAKDLFSPATRAQVDLGRKVAAQIPWKAD